MLRALILSTRVSFTISCNHFLFYLQKLPWLGKKIPDSIYNNRDIKLGLALLVELVKQLFGFLGPLLSLALFLIGPMFAMDLNLENTPLFYHYFFFIYLLIGPLAGSIILQTRDLNAYILIYLLRLPAGDYLLSKVVYNLGIRVVRYLFVFMLVSLFVNINFLEILILSGYVLFAALIWEYLLLKFSIRLKTNPYEKARFILAPIIVLAVVCYGLPCLGIVLPMQGILLHGFTLILFTLLAGFSFRRLYNFDGYPAVTKTTISREKLLGLEDLFRDLKFADVNLTEEKLVQEKVTATADLQGYALFNHLFFTRHRRIIAKPMQGKVALVAGLALPIWGILFFKPDLHLLIQEKILAIFPTLIFFMYLLSTGEKFSRALFFNCDRYMLKEKYYRDKEALLTNFTERLKKSTILNLVPAAAVAVLLLGVGVIIGMGGEITRLLPMVLTIFSLALFFSTHYLFLYYMFQPYTVDLDKKSPYYALANIFILTIVYGSIHIKITSTSFTLVVLLITLAYTGIAILLTYIFAHKTFKLR